MFYAIDALPARLNPPSKRKITDATATTTMTVKKSPKVPKADCPAVIVSVAVVLLLTTSMLVIWAKTIDPIPIVMATETILRAIGPKLSVALCSAK